MNKRILSAARISSAHPLLALGTSLPSCNVRPLTFSVLRLLSEQEFRSGQVLARSLDVSRASVWGALNEAQNAGIRIHRVHGRGYRLAGPLDWLDARVLAHAVSGTGLTIEVLQCCESTNAVLLARAEAGGAGGHVLTTEWQTHGRGRLGRTWHAGFASALTFSLLWRFQKGVASLAGLSLAIGVAIARVLNRAGVEVRLKWPNDVLWQERKLGGVLIEVRGEALGPCMAVIGIGLNVRLDAIERSRVDQPVADFADAHAPKHTRNEWLAKLLIELDAVLKRFETGGFTELRTSWNDLCAHRDKRVRLTLPDGTSVGGVSRGADEYGRLLVERAGVLEAYLSADISLRDAHAVGD